MLLTNQLFCGLVWSQNQLYVLTDTLSTQSTQDVPILNAWVRLQLGPSQARALNSELAALLARYLKQPVSGNARDYLVHAAVGLTRFDGGVAFIWIG